MSGFFARMKNVGRPPYQNWNNEFLKLAFKQQKVSRIIPIGGGTGIAQIFGYRRY
jgi:hypothetical protein